MVVLADQQFLTPKEYLELEAKSPVKHEYIDGEVYYVQPAQTSSTLYNSN